MAKEHRDAILSKVKSAGVTYDHTVHEPVQTSQHAALMRGVSLASGAKAIVMAGKKSGDRILVVLPGDRKIDSKALRDLVGERMQFESDVESAVGCRPGSVPPFGSVLGLQTYVDNDLADEINFNIGLLTESMRLSKADYLSIEQPITGNFSQTS